MLGTSNLGSWNGHWYNDQLVVLTILKNMNSSDWIMFPTTNQMIWFIGLILGKILTGNHGVFTIKLMRVSCNFSCKPIQWLIFHD